MNRLQARRPKFWLPADYAKHFREGQQSVIDARAVEGPAPPARTPSLPPGATRPPSNPDANFPPGSDASTCQYRTSDGRRCRMLRAANHPEFCHHHAEQQLRALGRTPVEPLAAEILGPVREFRTGAAINAALGNMFVQLANGRLDSRRAAVLTYIAQLMFQTLKKVGWEQIDRSPTPNLEAALSAMLQTHQPTTKAAKAPAGHAAAAPTPDSTGLGGSEL